MKKKTQKQMKAQSAKAQAKSPAKPKAKPSQVEKARKLPLTMFHTLKGPVMGHAKPGGRQYVRVWAPAALHMPSPSNVLFLPVAFCEEYIDLSLATLFGIGTVPEIVAQGYDGFFENFLKGNYRMQPVAMRAGIEGDTHSVEDPEGEGDDVPAHGQTSLQEVPEGEDGEEGSDEERGNGLDEGEGDDAEQEQRE